MGYDNLPAGYTVTYTLNGTALTGNTFTMPANDNATVDASTALITYNITYDLDGGSVATANPTTYNVTTPTFTLNNPTKAGYTFTGWTGSNGTTPQTTVTIAQGSTGDRSYTAQWTQYAFTLSLGTDITASGTVAFTLDGTDYYFAGTEITLAYGGTIPEGQHLVFKVNGNAIEGDTFEMPAADVVVDAVLLELERYYIYNSTTGELALLLGEFNKDNKWGSEVTASEVTSVTATDEVSFTGDCYNLFQGFTNCTSMDLNNVNTDNLTNIRCMFWGCQSLTTLNLSSWNTANVTNMSGVFDGCSGLQSLDLTGWNTANVTDMSGMFYSCSGLQSLDLSGWNTAKVTNMQCMFYGCSGLQSLDLSGWNTAKVTYMSSMFSNCSGLQSLNVSGWSTANVTNMSGMFRNCTNLATIYVGEGWSTSRVNWSSDMFFGCTSLVGGMGTAYDAYHIDKAYARIDRGQEQPGYFTGRFTKEIAGYGNDENPGGYYLIASPVGTVDPQNVTYMLDNSYDLYYFDQAENQEWRNYEASAFDLEAGKGYLYANSEDVTLVFFGMPYSGNGEVTLSKTTGVEWEGWNLVGNPFNETAYIADGRSFYTMNGDGSEIIAVTNGSIEAMEGVFVIANEDGESMTFTTTEPANNDKAMLALNLSQGRGPSTGSWTTVIDRAIVRFGEGRQLPKFQIRSNSTKIYIPQDSQDYAVVSAETQGELPLNFKAKENGSYTLSVNTENVETIYLHLIDNMTGNDIDLLATPSYTFTSKTTDYASRFRLVFSVCGDADGDNAFAFISNGNIIVNGEGVLQIVDVMGHIVWVGDAMNRVSTSGMPAGVYVLRLINGNDIKTQKIVVR